MKKVLYKLMRIFPWLEVLAQCVYANLDQNKRKVIKGKIQTHQVALEKNVQLEEVLQTIREFGIKKGDLVMVHSSMNGLMQLDATPMQLIEGLLELVGEEGTLAMAAFPRYKVQNDIILDGETYTKYDVKRTGISTGMLPMIFCKCKGVRRSKCPMNSIAVKGKLADEMLRTEMDTDLVHGRKSAWGYLKEHHAKILYLGLPITDADTIVHAAEDFLDEEWPIADWYEKSNYIIVNGNEEERVTFRVRKGFWHRFFTAQYSGKILDKNDFVQRRNIRGVEVELLNDADLYVEYLINQAKKGKMLYRIPKRYWKKRNDCGRKAV